MGFGGLEGTFTRFGQGPGEVCFITNVLSTSFQLGNLGINKEIVTPIVWNALFILDFVYLEYVVLLT